MSRSLSWERTRRNKVRIRNPEHVISTEASADPGHHQTRHHRATSRDARSERHDPQTSIFHRSVQQVPSHKRKGWTVLRWTQRSFLLQQTGQLHDFRPNQCTRTGKERCHCYVASNHGSHQSFQDCVLWARLDPWTFWPDRHSELYARLRLRHLCSKGNSVLFPRFWCCWLVRNWRRAVSTGKSSVQWRGLCSHSCVIERSFLPHIPCLFDIKFDTDWSEFCFCLTGVRKHGQFDWVQAHQNNDKSTPSVRFRQVITCTSS